MTSTDEAAFLAALRENEDDDLTRLVFADWLDEHDRPEDANRMRAWRAAKDWLTAFAAKCGNNYPDYGFDGMGDPEPITYEMVVDAGRANLASKWWDGLTQYGAEDARDLMADDDTRREYWRNWSIVTGIPVPDDKAEDSPFSCSC